MEQKDAANRDFNTISPSAKWVLLMKGHTTIPFARQTAELVSHPDKFTPDFDNKDLWFWGRTMHFEYRYLSIDVLLADLPIRNILELSSGFSFRGLDLTQREDVYYIDTDLPDMIAQKQQFITALRNDLPLKGKLELAPLNALDAEAFHKVVTHFPPGPIVIVNEGLLVYFDMLEKETLCRIIRSVLKERGGYWITADIYLALTTRNIDLGLDPQTKKFFEDHHVEQNRFESFEAAAAFFKRMGFVIDQEAAIDYTTLSSFQYMVKNATPEALSKMKDVGKIHTTWRLRLADA